MITVILHQTQKQITNYKSQITNLLDKEDELVIVQDENASTGDIADTKNVTFRTINKTCNIVSLYNVIVEESNKQSDILLISDCVIIHGDAIKKMHSCLHTAEKNAIVNGQEIENKRSLIKTAEKYLTDDYSLSIETNIHCMMIKREVINTLGFLDTSYTTLKYALMDYYCRINRFGFSSITAHHALFSYSERVETIESEDDKTRFLTQHTHWEKKEKQSAKQGEHPAVQFLTLLDKEYYTKKRILFDCIIMPAMYCGTSEYQLSIFEAFNRIYGEKYDIFLYINKDAAEFFDLECKYDNILYPGTISGTFHLGYAPNQLMFYEPQVLMNERCLFNVQTMFDIMMVRIDEHTQIDVNGDVELGIRLCDGIVFISNFTKNDFLSCFNNKIDINNKQLRVIYPATRLASSKEDVCELPYENYFLVIGNKYKHKAIKEVVDAVKYSEHNYIIIGYGENGFIEPNIYNYRSGYIEDDFLSYLYENSTAVIFPSLYEGFGLPVVVSLKNNKRVILKNNEVNNELREYFSEFKENFLFFDNFNEIGEIINSTDFSHELKQANYIDTWDRVADELETLFNDILESEVDIDELKKRWYLYKLTEAKMENAEEMIAAQRSEISYLTTEIVPILSKPFEMRKLFPLLSFAIKTYIRNRHNKLLGYIRNLKKS